MTVQNSQRSKEYLETAQTLLCAAKTTTGIVLGLAVSALAFYAIVQAPTERRIAERLTAEQIQREDREHCERFRVQPGSEDFAACVADLTEIRRHQRDRSLAEASGMF